MPEHSYPDHPRWPYNTDHLHEILASGDRVEMMQFFRKFKEYADGREGAPIHWQRFIGKILVMAAENPADAIVELGLSKKTDTQHRDELLAMYIHRLKMEEEARRGEEDYAGSLGVALIKAESATGIKYGTLSRIYANQDDDVKQQAENHAAGELPLPIDTYLVMIEDLKNK